jgi:hypothetical protein
VTIDDRLSLWRQYGWQIETDLRDLKQALRLEVLGSRSPAMIRKELAAATVAYNLVVLTRELAAARAEVEPRSLSFSRICSLVKVLLRVNSPVAWSPPGRRGGSSECSAWPRNVRSRTARAEAIPEKSSGNRQNTPAGNKIR